MLFVVGRLHPRRSRPTDPASIFYNDQRNFIQTSYIGSKLRHGLTISQKVRHIMKLQKADIELIVVADGREAMGAAQKDDERVKLKIEINFDRSDENRFRRSPCHAIVKSRLKSSSKSARNQPEISTV
jgi:hypothetical protein